MFVPRRRMVGLLFASAVLLAACVSQVPPRIDVTQRPVVSDSPSSTPTAAASPPMGSESPLATPSEVPGSTLYSVLAGDTLASIARRFSTNVSQLQAWNGARYPSLASDPGTLLVGWQLVVADEPGITPLPTATLRPTSPPVAACHAGSRVAAPPVAVYRSIPAAGPEVALTFDMGGRLDPALQIMNYLVAHKVCATIFPTGAMSLTPIGQQVLAIIKAHPELFEVGNHTMHHCDLVHGGLGSPTTAPCATGGPPSAAFVRKELTDAAAILKDGTGQDPAPYWRPPYGTYNQAVLNAAASVGYTKTLLWDIDTIDWKPMSEGGPTAQQIANKVVGGAVNGSVVLMHLGGYETFSALQSMVPGLRQRGFTLTSISDQLDGR